MSRISLHKFFAQNRTPDGQPLQWPGSPEGFPFLGRTSPNLRGDDIDNLPVQLNYRSKRFELWDDAQKAEFDNINDRILSGICLKLNRKDWINEEHQHVVVWLEWAEVYAVNPTQGGDGNDFFSTPAGAGY